jgi:Fe-S oxidoreductase
MPGRRSSRLGGNEACDIVIPWGRPPHQRRKQRTLPTGALEKRNPEVLYYAGCQTRQNHPAIMEANVKFLAALGIDWGMLDNEGCCSMSLYKPGYADEARRMAQRLVERISRARPRILLRGCPHSASAPSRRTISNARSHSRWISRSFTCPNSTILCSLQVGLG